MEPATPIEVEANGLSIREIFLRLVLPRLDRVDSRLGTIESSQATAKSALERFPTVADKLIVIETRQLEMKAKLEELPTSDTCPLKKDIEGLKVITEKNTDFRKQVKTVIAVIAFLSLIAGAFGGLIVYLLGG